MNFFQFLNNLLSVAIILTVNGSVFGKELQFYGNYNYQNLIYTKEVSYKDGCQTFPAGINPIKSIQNNGTCVFLFMDNQCRSTRTRVGAETTGDSYLQLTPLSFQVCAPPVLIAHNDEKHFFEVKTLMNWNQADQHCKSLNMKLASITSNAEANLLQNYYFPKNSANCYWTSGICWDKNCTNINQFSWQNAAPLDSSYNSIIHKHSYVDNDNTNHLCYKEGRKNCGLVRLDNQYVVYVLCEIKSVMVNGFEDSFDKFLFNFE